MITIELQENELVSEEDIACVNRNDLEAELAALRSCIEALNTLTPVSRAVVLEMIKVQISDSAHDLAAVCRRQSKLLRTVATAIESANKKP